jgi:hypothetical protein
MEEAEKEEIEELALTSVVAVDDLLLPESEELLFGVCILEVMKNDDSKVAGWLLTLL